MNKKVLVIIVLIAAGIVVADVSSSILPTTVTAPITTQPPNQSKLNTIEQKYTDNPYVSLVDWPPVLQTSEQPLECTQSGTPEGRAGMTVSKTIGGQTFCMTDVAEGAAGSVYHQYAYATEVNGATKIYAFSVRMVQCHNYDEPQTSECIAAQEAFNPDDVAAILPLK